MGGKELKWCQLTHTQLMSLQGPHISAHSTAETNDKAQISGRMASIGISDVVTASVYSEKTRLKKLMMITIMNKSQETPFFSWAPEIDFRYETKARKVMVDFNLMLYTGMSP